MNNIKVSDISLRVADSALASGLSFKEKLEIAKLLEKLNVDVIETSYVTEDPAERSTLPSSFMVPGMGAISHSPFISGAKTTRVL